MLKTWEVKGCIASFCKLSQSNYSSFPRGITHQLFRARVIKTTLMILLLSSTSVKHNCFYCYNYYHMIIIFFIIVYIYIRYKELMQKKESVWITSYLSRGGSPPSMPFAEVGVFFSDGSSLILSLFITTTMIMHYY